MRKLGFISLADFNIIDVLILVFVIGGILFSLYTIVGDDGDVGTYVFDSETIQTLPQKYTTFYEKGEIVRLEVTGYDRMGKYNTVNGTITWVDLYRGGNVKIRIIPDNSTEPLLIAYDVDNADVYINQAIMKNTGDKYNDVVDIEIKPQRIESLNDLINGIDNSTNCTVTTRVSVNNINNNLFQNLSNTLFRDLRRESVRPTFKNAFLQLAIVTAEREDIWHRIFLER